MKKKIAVVLIAAQVIMGVCCTNVMAADELSSNTTVIKAIQEALTKKGYDCGTADGSVGPTTNEQIYKYLVDSLEIDLDALGISLDTSEYSEYSYDTLARYPDEYTGRKVQITGEVLQVIESDDVSGYRIATERTRYGYSADEVFMVLGSTPSVRILEDDIVTVYGTSSGLYTYETVMGGTLSIPSILFDTITVN